MGFNYLFFLPVMLPSEVPRLTTDSPVRVFPGVWKLLSFSRLPSLDRSPSLSLLSLFSSFITFYSLIAVATMSSVILNRTGKGTVLRWRRNRMGRPRSLPQTH